MKVEEVSVGGVIELEKLMVQGVIMKGEEGNMIAMLNASGMLVA